MKLDYLVEIEHTSKGLQPARGPQHAPRGMMLERFDFYFERRSVEIVDGVPGEILAWLVSQGATQATYGNGSTHYRFFRHDGELTWVGPHPGPGRALFD